MKTRRLAIVMAGLSLAGTANARGPAPANAGWPCEVEPKPVLAPGDYWGAAAAGAKTWRADPALATLVAEVAPRSMSTDDATARLRQFVNRSAAPEPTRASLAAGLVETIDAERQTIIAGIRRFNVRQDHLARSIEQSYTALDQPDAKADATRRAAITDQAQWDTRVFEDRQRLLPIICSQPAALEKRLGTLVAALRETAPP